MVSLLVVTRILVVAGMFYALHKGRKDWVRILFITSAVLISLGYSLDRNWTFAVLQIIAMLIAIRISTMKGKSN